MCSHTLTIERAQRPTQDIPESGFDAIQTRHRTTNSLSPQPRTGCLHVPVSHFHPDQGQQSSTHPSILLWLRSQPQAKHAQALLAKRFAPADACHPQLSPATVVRAHLFPPIAVDAEHSTTHTTSTFSPCRCCRSVTYLGGQRQEFPGSDLLRRDRASACRVARSIWIR
jgi:hypothetical protein